MHLYIQLIFIEFPWKVALNSYLLDFSSTFIEFYETTFSLPLLGENYGIVRKRKRNCYKIETRQRFLAICYGCLSPAPHRPPFTHLIALWLPTPLLPYHWTIITHFFIATQLSLVVLNFMYRLNWTTPRNAENPDKNMIPANRQTDGYLVCVTNGMSELIYPASNSK